MASIFSHALVALTLGKTSFEKSSVKLLTLGAFCAILPDADVLTFKLGIAYEDMLGHRGFFHSFSFCLLLAVFIKYAFYSRIAINTAKAWKYILYFFICGASHALLDAMTTGGLGVAFFAPFNEQRYFLPWRPIKVSPIGVHQFFSSWGLQVIKSELLWIALPCGAVLVAKSIYKSMAKR